MCKAICGANCAECGFHESCKGCAETNGCPFGKKCAIAKYIELGGFEAYCEFKNGLIDEINALNIEGMAKLTQLTPLVGSFVNLEYPLANGTTVKFLNDDEMYLGMQLESELDGEKCFGVIANADFFLVCRYDENAANPELLRYVKR